MATLFDFIIVHESKAYAQQAAWEAIKEIDRLDNELSRFNPNSDITRINNLTTDERIILSIDTFNCLSRGIELYYKTKGAFNIACGALLKCWLNSDYTLKTPTDYEIDNALKLSRIENISINKEDYSLEILLEGTTIDLGAFGKGYALDIVSDIFIEWNINCALISAGRSSIKAIGVSSGNTDWQISISNPIDDKVLKTFSVSDISLGASGVIKGRHIINTIKGYPEINNYASWVFSKSAADADAFSTACMILNNEATKEIVDENFSVLVMNKDESENSGFIECGSLPQSINLV